MISIARRLLLLALVLCPTALSAAPVTLKLSFFTSDLSNVYQCQIRPFVEAVNAEGAGVVEIKVFFSGTGAISTVIPDQPRLVREGAADLALIVPGQTPQEFPDTAVLQLPGLYRDEREASLVFTRLVAAGALEGYPQFVVVGAYVSADEHIHSRKPVSGLVELQGQTIRVNNAMQASTLRKLGATPVLLPINRATDKLSDGTLDGVTVPPWMVAEFGFARLTENHFLLPLGGAPTALIMNRDKFAQLPAAAREIISKFSGTWSAEQEATCAAAKNRDALVQLKANSRRKVSEPSASDLMTIRDVYTSVVRSWTAESNHNRELLAQVMAELAKLRKEPAQ